MSSFRSWPFLRWSRNSLLFIEPECSSVHSQVPATCPCQRLIDLVHATPFRFIKVNLHVIFSSMSVSSMSSLSLRFTYQKPVNSSPFPILATCAAYLNLLDVITQKIFGGEYRSLSSSLCSFIHSPLTSSLLGPNNTRITNTLFSNTLSLHSSLCQRPYFTSINRTGKSYFCIS